MLILGHRGTILRGFSSHPWQNSMAAFALALEHADGFETDAYRTYDGEIFLIHASTYAQADVIYNLEEHLDEASRMIVAGRRLEGMMAGEARKLRLRDKSALPSLPDILSLFEGRPDKILNIELKGEGTAKLVMEQVDQAVAEEKIMRNQIIVSSFDHPALAELRKTHPDQKLGALFARDNQKRALMFPWADNLDSAYVPFHTDCLHDSVLKAIRPNYVILPEPTLRPAYAEAIARHYPEAKLIVWTVTELMRNNAQELLEKVKVYKTQLAAIIIDDPRQAKEIRKELER